MDAEEFFIDDPLGDAARDLLSALQPGMPLTAGRLLMAFNGQGEEELAALLDALADKGVVPDVSDLPQYGVNSELGLRLRREEQLAKQKDFLDKLEASDPLRLFLEELAQIPTCKDLTQLAEELAAENIAGFQETVRNQALNAGLSRVVELACAFAGKGVLLTDLIQDCSIGLWQSLGEYTAGDLEQFLDQQINRYLTKTVILQAYASDVGQRLRQAVEDYRAVDEKLLSELGRNPTLQEIAENLHISQEEAQSAAQMLENARRMRQVKQPEPEDIPQEEDQAVEDTAYFQMRQRIAELLSVLPAEDAELLKLRYGLEGKRPLDAVQTAARLGLTPEEVTLRETAALSKLRQQ